MKNRNLALTQHKYYRVYGGNKEVHYVPTTCINKYIFWIECRFNKAQHSNVGTCYVKPSEAQHFICVVELLRILL